MNVDWFQIIVMLVITLVFGTGSIAVYRQIASATDATKTEMKAVRELMEEKFSKVDVKFDSLHRHIDDRHDHINLRLERHGDKLRDHEQRIRTIEKK